MTEPQKKTEESSDDNTPHQPPRRLRCRRTRRLTEQACEDAGLKLDPRAYSSVIVIVAMETVRGDQLLMHACISRACFEGHLNPGTLRNQEAKEYGKDITRAHHKLREVEASHGVLCRARRSSRRKLVLTLDY